MYFDIDLTVNEDNKYQAAEARRYWVRFNFISSMKMIRSTNHKKR